MTLHDSVLARLSNEHLKQYQMLSDRNAICAYCASKPHAVVSERDGITTFQVSAAQFAALHRQLPGRIHLSVGAENVAKLSAEYPSVQLIPNVLSWCIIPLDDSVPPDKLLDSIDTAYAFARSQLDEEQSLVVDLVDRGLSQLDLLKTLIEWVGLDNRREALLNTVRPAIRVISKPPAIRWSTRGRSKFGGSPNLPPMLKTPTCPARAELPSHGMLYFFSTFGRYDFPEVPEDWNDPNNSAVVFYNSDLDILENSFYQQGQPPYHWFPEAEVEFKPHLQFADPASSLLDSWELSHDEYGRLIRLARLYDDVCFYGLQDKRHWLLGHEMAIQYNPLSREGERLLFQIDSDDLVNFVWGDLGRLYFFIQAENLSKSVFDKIRVELISH
jgi:hypothetical protein